MVLVKIKSGNFHNASVGGQILELSAPSDPSKVRGAHTKAGSEAPPAPSSAPPPPPRAPQGTSGTRRPAQRSGKMKTYEYYLAGRESRRERPETKVLSRCSGRPPGDPRAPHPELAPHADAAAAPRLGPQGTQLSPHPARGGVGGRTRTRPAGPDRAGARRLLGARGNAGGSERKILS